MTSEPNAISADVLNSAMQSLGLPDLRFEAVEGKPVLRKAYDDISLEHFIGLLLTGIAGAHLQRVDVAALLDEIEDQVVALKASDQEGETHMAAIERIASLIAESRHILSAPALTRYPGEAVAPKLTIGPIEADPDLH